MDTKQQVILQALSHPETSQMSNRAIARLLEVDESSVRYWRGKGAGECGTSAGQNAPHSPAPEHHPIAQTHQAIAVLNPVKVRFEFMGSSLEGEGVAVLMDWKRLIPCAILINHRYGQTQVPLRMAEILV